MAESNMKYRPIAEMFSDMLDTWWFLALSVVIFALIGLISGNILGAVIGVGIGIGLLFAVGTWWSREASELEWSDVEQAVKNYPGYYRRGAGGVKFRCRDRMFVFEKRKVFRYTEDQVFVVWYKTKQWGDILDETDDALFTELCGRTPIRDVGLEESKTILIPQHEGTEQVLETCEKLIKHFIAKAGATVKDVTARSDLVVWVDPKYQRVSPVPILSCNFKGKKDGRPVIYLPDRKGYWILHEDGEVEQFVGFDAWWKRTG